MADSVRLRILKNAAEALRGINGNVGGYTYTVRSAESVTLDPTLNILTIPGPQLPVFVIEPTPAGHKEFEPADQLLEVFNVNVTARADAPAADRDAKAETWEALAADIERALTRDIRRGGLCSDTRVGVCEPFVGVGGLAVLLVQPVEFRIHRTYGEP